MRALGEAGVAWGSRVPETSGPAPAGGRGEPAPWPAREGAPLCWGGTTMGLARGRGAWGGGRCPEGEQRARLTLQRQFAREQAKWEQRWWHLSRRAFACAPDAQAALEQEQRQLPPWLVVQTTVVAVPKYGRVGRPRQDTPPVTHEGH